MNITDIVAPTVNVFENDTLHVDFKPLFECIHIYTRLDSLDELQKSYQADRKASITPEWHFAQR